MFFKILFHATPPSRVKFDKWFLKPPSTDIDTINHTQCSEVGFDGHMVIFTMIIMIDHFQKVLAADCSIVFLSQPFHLSIPSKRAMVKWSSGRIGFTSVICNCSATQHCSDTIREGYNA